ncbi:hypothetical protein [Streptomyces sp. NPDC060002]|uniref:hypothetical protein n=1 Tax=Streptomyces sp. NPDC060002 TaxID=3347033 RepID=UPI0036AEA11D
MDRIQVGELLQLVLGGPISRRTLHTLFTASGGNALFLRELVLGAVQSGALKANGEIWEISEKRLAVTPHLNDLITARISTAAPAARPLLESLAFCGALSLADAISTADRTVLTQLERSGIIQVSAHGRRMTAALAHPLYGEVIAAGISPLQRYDLALRMAERLETYGLKPRDDALHIASWRLAATGTADPDLLLHAAAIAINSNDNEQVIELLTAIKAEDRTSESRILLGRALMHAGQLERAEAVLAEADTHARNDHEKLAAVTTRCTNLFWSSPQPDKALSLCFAARSAFKDQTAIQQLRLMEGFMLVASGLPEDGLQRLDVLPDRPPEDGLDTWLLAVQAKAQGLAIVGRVAQAKALASMDTESTRRSRRENSCPVPRSSSPL